MATTKWALDPTHSDLQFKVKHLMITTVTGNIKSFGAELTSEGDDFTNADISFSGDINSIDTGNGDRDAHLKSGDFFDAEKYPTLSFKSTSVEKDGSDYVVKGDLTIKDVAKTVK